FFFSSRRRHTRCYRDWSSDVCSSDLGGLSLGGPPLRCASASVKFGWRRTIAPPRRFGTPAAAGGRAPGGGRLMASTVAYLLKRRSEERRVGKEGPAEG